MQDKRPKVRYYRRSLPHIFPENGIIFFTYSLNGALPKMVIDQVRFDRMDKLRVLRKRDLSPIIIEKEINKINEFYFGKYDTLIDNPGSGPVHLKDPRVAQLIADSIHFLDQRSYDLICFCIMPNHVHKIVKETIAHLPFVMQSHKGYTGRSANKLLNRSGQFWQRETFDHVLREELQLIKKVKYTMMNPVSAGLVDHYTDWPYTYINPDYQWIMHL